LKGFFPKLDIFASLPFNFRKYFLFNVSNKDMNFVGFRFCISTLLTIFVYNFVCDLRRKQMSDVLEWMGKGSYRCTFCEAEFHPAPGDPTKAGLPEAR
jgi:hypothetical protein